MIEPEEDFPDYSKDDESADLLEMQVPIEHGGLRLDQALVKLFPEYSRSRLQDWIEQGLVTVNGAPGSVKQKVWGGETVCVLPQIHPSEQPYVAEDIPLDIVYEDDAIMVIDKPVGLVVHPGSGNWQGTLLNALLHHAPQLADVPRAGIVHRLDKDTSGLMVVAKTLVAQTALIRQMQARSVKREYLALVWGELDRDYTVNVPIGRHPTQRVKMAVTESGKEAVTHIRIETRFPYCTLVRCRLETGRTHQIRVHLTHLGFPILGDDKYGDFEINRQAARGAFGPRLGRMFLHAFRVRLAHPVRGVPLLIEAPLPPDCAAWLQARDPDGTARARYREAA